MTGPAPSSDPRAPVAAIVVTWNSAAWIEACLASLESLERPPAEIVVVDNGSVDATPDLVRRACPAAALVEGGTNLGYCRANNLGIARTRNPFVLVLNPDARLAPRFLEEILPAFDDPRVGIAAGKLLRPDGRTLDSAGQRLGRSRQPIDRGYGEPDTGRYDRDEEVFGACGAAAVYRRAMLDDVVDPGGQVFDEAFFAFYEDLDLAWRARRAGWRAAYRHRAVGWHARGATAGDPGVRVRGRAILSRSADSRYHIAKNRYLAILRNDDPAAYLRNLPFILARNLVTIALLLSLSPGVLVRLWRGRSAFRGAIERRRLDAARGRRDIPTGGAGTTEGRA